jgi:beta-glucosidase
LVFEIEWSLDEYAKNMFLDPLFFGDYPHQMRQILGPNLPKFTEGEKQLLKKQIDFIGVNHYDTFYAKDCIYSLCDLDLYTVEALVFESAERKGIPIGKPVKVSTVHCIILFNKNPTSKLILHNLTPLN